MSNEDNPKQPAADELVAVLGSIEVEVEYRPVGKEEKGKKELVKVRELGADEMLRYNATIDFEASTAELFCSKPNGWADSLTRESLLQVIALGEKDLGNLKYWSGWRTRQAARTEKLVPGTMDVLEIALKKIIDSRSPKQSGGDRDVASD